MTTKEKVLLYFRDINYAYNDCTRLDALEKGLSELEEVVRCKDCKFNYANQIPSDDVCQLCVELPISKDFYCAYGERKDDADK